MKIKYFIMLMPVIFLMGCSKSGNISDKSQTKVLAEEYQQFVNHFKTTLRSGDKGQLAELFRFPFNRAYPVPEIKDSEDFIQRYDHIFDDDLIQEILNSSTEKDWQTFGWRGITFKRGLVWMGDDGSIIAVNHATKKEELYKQKILNQIKNSLHSSLQNFKSPDAYLETKKLRIRVDSMSDDTYRYAVWPISKEMSKKPDLVIKNGTKTFDGTGGNYHYTFLNDKYKYEIYFYRIGGEETPPAHLTIYKENKTVLKQDIIKFEN
ncbi:MAG: hypothetical protein H7A32_02260 [Deltaproteobacteria bacterium]|nr:hypothetical protein [Deltaproteobacteria bacterium]